MRAEVGIARAGTSLTFTFTFIPATHNHQRGSIDPLSAPLSQGGLYFGTIVYFTSGIALRREEKIA